MIRNLHSLGWIVLSNWQYCLSILLNNILYIQLAAVVNTVDNIVRKYFYSYNYKMEKKSISDTSTNEFKSNGGI